MFRDLSVPYENGSSNVLLPFKQLFKKTNSGPCSGPNALELQRAKSASQSKKELTICVRNAYKSYGAFMNAVQVLEDLNMTVTKGDIYGLLGASGCGKTTILGCILGQKRLNSGHIWVLGGTPGSKASGVPGPQVGYMPQVTALYGEFTASETMYYYGWVAGLTNEKIKERFKNLRELLMLPDTEQLIKNLSGGQQRRVSLAVALLHEPELLILDEPTVGVDPILREIIWEHLLKITSDKTVTIVITTHYIEEARQANVVGLMRGGYLLAEEEPEALITRFRTQTLEEIFLKLSIKQNTDMCLNKKEILASNSIKVSDNTESTQESSTQPGVSDLNYLPDVPPDNTYVTELGDYLPKMNKKHIKSLVWKGFLWMWRNLPAMFCVIMLPVTQIPVLIFAIGNDPVNLRVAVTNYETNNSVECNQTISCYSNHLSCVYLEYLEKRALHMIYFDSEDAARQSVLRGTNHAAFVVKRNYSDALRNRLDKWETTKPWDMTSSEIDVLRDISNKHIATQMRIYLYDTFQTFIQDYLESCGVNRKLIKIPFQWKDPVYGVAYPHFTEFVLPGFLVILTFFLAVAATAFGMLIERNEGSFERTFVIGITEIELLGAHLICQFFITASQVAMSLICAFLVFNMTQNGSMVLVAAHLLLTGCLGMCYGLLVSCFCDREETATYLAVGSVLPMICLGGMIWPIEGLHRLFRPVAYILPLTPAIESLRNILQRGWGILYKSVYLGFVSMSLWIFVLLIVSILLLKYKKS